MSELEQGQADIATCLIYADNPDRLRNVERVIKTRGVGAVSEYDSSPQDWKYSCNAADIPEYIGGALTANLADKLFRAELFKSFESIAWDTLQAPEMLFGQAKVAFLPFRYIEQVPVSCGFEKASELGQSVIARAQSSLAIVPNDSRNKYKSSWAAASAIAFLGAYERIADKEGKRAFLESAHMADGANAVIEQILSDPLLDTGYRERLNVLWREEPQDAMVSELTLRAKEARKEQRRFEDVEFYFATENYEFYHSITYRFGRMFVDSAKKCLSLFSRVKREEIHSK